MANLGAILANRGHYFTPHLIRSEENESYVDEHKLGIDRKYYDVVIDGMEQVVSMGSGIRGYIPDIVLCGKTSTVENSHGLDHSGFMGFAPKESPQIAVAAYVENVGWGGRAAGSTASLLVEKYIRGEVTRPWLEEYVKRGYFGDERPAEESD